MKINTYVCQGCGAKTEDLYSEGWVQIDGKISRSHGRDNSRCAITDYIAAPNTMMGDQHTFCSVACLEKKLDDIAKGREPRCSGPAKIIQCELKAGHAGPCASSA